MTSVTQDTRPGENAIALWEQLTGRPVESLSYGGDLDDFSLYKANKLIVKSIQTGDEAIVTLLIRSQVPLYAKAIRFPLMEYRNGSARITAMLEAMDALDALFCQAHIAKLHGEYLAYAEGALAFYRNIDPSKLTEATREFVATEGAGVALDALGSLDKLTRLMIQDGVPAPATTAKLDRHIYQVSRIEDLMCHARQIPPGFSLCVIRGANVASSYFVMLVRTGNRILALTDKGTFEHPLQEEMMSARNERHNAYRIEGSHFPYSLLHLQWLDRGRVVQDLQPQDRNLPTHGGFPVLADIGELGDRELLWLQLFIDQCQHRYFDQGMTEPLMATGSALRIAHKLDNSQDQYPVLMSTAVTLVPRASKDLNAAYFNETEPGWARKRNPNLWMERFADQVPDDFLYIPESVIQAGQLQIGLDSQGALTLSHGESRKGLFEAELKSISANTLNTPERLVADAHWTARYNQAQIIRGLVQADYDQRQQGVQRWFYEAVAKNLPSILDDLLLANHARFLLPRTANGRAIVGVKSGKFRNIGYDYVIRTKQHGPDPSDKVRMEHLIGVTNKSAHQWDCYLQRDQHVHANLFITLSTETIYDIVAITGLALGDIPPELHTRGLGTYPANHNLERLDPLAKLRNPWDNLRLRFRLPVEYKAFKAYRSARGLKTPLTHELYAWGKAGGRLAHNEVMQSIGGNECGLGDEAWS